MKTFSSIVAALSIAALSVLASQSAQAAGLEKLYILNCGEGTAGDISRWSPGVNEGKSMPFVDNCYLLKHSSRLDAVGHRPRRRDRRPCRKARSPPIPRRRTGSVRRRSASQLDALGVKPADIKFVAVSHTHPDHVGNVEMFPQAMLYVQKAEYDWPGANNTPRFKPEHPVTKLEGDKDIFGDGSVTIISTPGHTPGHQSLLVKLPKTGALVLSGDAVHFKSNWDNRGVPAGNTGQEQTKTSMEKIAGVLAKEKATLWINHDKAQRDS